MMKKVLSLILGLTLSVAVIAEEVNESIDAATDGHVTVSNVSGEITVNGWSRNTVEVTGSVGRNVEELIVRRDGDKILVKVKLPRKGGRGTDGDLHINIPEGNSLDVGTVSADIDVRGVAGEQSLNTVSGDVDTVYSGAPVGASSVSGDVEVSGDGSEGEVKANSVSGDVTVYRAGGEIEAITVTGDLAVDEGSFDRAVLETVNGSLIFQGELKESGKLEVDSVNGDVDIEFEGDVSARVYADTLNGSIRNCFGPEPVRTSRYGPGIELEFTEGGGAGKVTVSTVNGDIGICK